MCSERLRAWSGRVQWTFGSGERACTHNETQRDEANIAIVTRLAQFPKPYQFDDLLTLSCVVYDAPICLRM